MKYKPPCSAAIFFGLFLQAGGGMAPLASRIRYCYSCQLKSVENIMHVILFKSLYGVKYIYGSFTPSVCVCIDVRKFYGNKWRLGIVPFGSEFSSVNTNFLGVHTYYM